MGRLCLLGCRVHPESRTDPGAADEPRLRGQGVRGGPARRAALGRAGRPAPAMNAVEPIVPALCGRTLHKAFRRDNGQVAQALNDVSLEVGRGTLTALVGPDGAGKTTLIRLATGLMAADAGELHVLGFDVARDPQQVQNSIGYMPQRFGLYEDLSVQENLDLYADLHSVGLDERHERYPRLMEMTALGPFTRRPAGK